MAYNMKPGSKQTNTPGTFSKKQEDKIKEIQLNNVTVSVLSKESYAKLNQAQKQVYDYMTPLEGPKGNKGIKPKEAIFVDKNTNQRRTIDPITATKMLGDTGVTKISNEPSMFGPRKDSSKKNQRFRAHTNPFTNTIHVAAPKDKRPGMLGQYMKDVFAEAAHIADPKKYSMKSMFEGVAGVFNSKKQKASYNKKGSMEHRAHSIIEPQLIKKYTKPKK